MLFHSMGTIPSNMVRRQRLNCTPQSLISLEKPLASGVFTLNTPRDLLEKFRRGVYRQIHDPYNHDTLIDTAVTGYHLHEWVWTFYFERNAIFRRAFFETPVSCKTSFRKWVEAQNPSFSIVQEITNSLKHYTPHKSATISEVYESGWNHSTFGKGVWDAPAGVSVVSRDAHININEVLEDLLRFWDKLITNIESNSKIDKA
jgi:hypothetical protein